MSTPFEAEIRFLNRKLFMMNIKWEPLVAMSQIVTAAIPDEEARSIVNKLRETLIKKAGVQFPKMVFSMPSKLKGGTRVIIAVSLLRDFFSDEIDGWSGGGGRRYNPLSTRPGKR